MNSMRVVIGRTMLQANYGPLRLSGEVTSLGATDGEYTPRFTADGPCRQASPVIAWQDISHIEIEFSGSPVSRLFEFLANALANIGVAAGPSMAAKESRMYISLTSGNRVSWWFDTPSPRSTTRWSRKNLEALFDELSSVGMLPLLADPATAGRLLERLSDVKPLFPWRRRGQIADIIERIQDRS
jgi:hypothetical protein